MNVLLLGDSHTVGHYGVALEKLLEGAGHNVTRVGIVGAAAYHYNTGKHKSLKGMWVKRVGDFDTAKTQRYDLAVVSLGTNDVTGWTPAESARQIQALMQSLNATRKVWVGPPAFSAYAAQNYNKDYAKKDLNTRVQELWAILSPVYGRDAIDPRDATRPHVLKKDIHLDAPGGTAWAVNVYETLMGQDIPVAVEQQVEDQVEDTPMVSDKPTGRDYLKLAIGLACIAAAVVIWRRRRDTGRLRSASSGK